MSRLFPLLMIALAIWTLVFAATVAQSRQAEYAARMARWGNVWQR
ncbi:MAG: hypothetical protein U0821_18770 [Chloroflexota bacterium]